MHSSEVTAHALQFTCHEQCAGVELSHRERSDVYAQRSGLRSDLTSGWCAIGQAIEKSALVLVAPAIESARLDCAAPSCLRADQLHARGEICDAQGSDLWIRGGSVPDLFEVVTAPAFRSTVYDGAGVLGVSEIKVSSSGDLGDTAGETRGGERGQLRVRGDCRTDLTLVVASPAISDSRGHRASSIVADADPSGAGEH